MARFSSIAKGRRARKPVTLPLGERTFDLDVRVLGPDDDIYIAAEATALAKAKGVTDPAPGNDVYDRYERALTVFRACVDRDSPVDAPVPVFDGVEAILHDPDLTRDHIAFLVEEQARFQDEVSPRKRNMSTAEYISAIAKTAEGDMGPFVGMSPGMQWQFVRLAARQLMSLQTHSSSSSPSSEASRPS